MLNDTASQLKKQPSGRSNPIENAANTSTLRRYSSLSEYAQQQGVPESTFTQAGWYKTTHQGRPALAIPTETGTRYRFIDGAPKLNKYTSPHGYQCCFYRLPEAVAIAEQSGQPLIFCNGEAGTVAAQYHGLAATCITGGESANISDELLVQFQAVWSGAVIIALDCDKTGRDHAPKHRARLQTAGYNVRAVDLELPDKGDLADFCKMHGSNALDALLTAPELPFKAESLKPIIQRRETSAPASDGAVDWENERRHWWVSVVIPAAERKSTMRRGKVFRCINPNHADEHPSARFSYQKTPDGVYVCTCGSHKRKEVAEWAGVPSFRDWWKAERAALFPTAKIAQSKSARRRHEKSAQAEKVSLAQRVKDVTLAPFTPDVTVNERYISDLSPAMLDGYGVAVIKSPMDTGKTEWIARIIAHKRQQLGHEPTCLYLCHSAPLTENVANRLGFVSYTDLPAGSGISIRSAPQLAITFDSAWRVAGVIYDLVIIDEGSKGLAQFGSATLRGGEKVRSYRAVRGLVASCQTVYALDAQNTDTVTAWLSAVKKGARVLSIENTYRPQSMSLTLLNSKAAAYAEIDARISENQGTVYIAVDSIAESILIHAYLQAQYPDKLGMLINSDNSQSKEAQAFLSAIYAELPELHYLICSPSIKSGVSIDAPIYAEIGIFTNPDFSADDRLQMMGRPRKVHYRAAFVQPSQGQRETDIQTIFAQSVQNASATGQVCNFSVRGIQPRNSDLDSVQKLLSLIQAERNRQLNDPLSFFVALARQEGYRVEFGERREQKEINAAYRELRKKLKQEHDQRVPNAVLVTGDEMDAHRQAGTVTPDIRAGFARWQIQTPFGFTAVTPQIQADLGRSSQRRRVSRLANTLDSMDALKDTDANEALEERIYDNRQHHTLQVQFMDARIREMFGCSLMALPDVLKDMPALELERHAAGLALYVPQLKSLFGYRPSHDAHESAIAQLRWFLRQFAIELDKRQVMVNRERFMVYSIDHEAWGRFMGYAQAMLKERQKARVERLLQTAKDSLMAKRSNPITQNHKPPSEERFNPVYLRELTALRC